jgi:hypothetical protein
VSGASPQSSASHLLTFLVAQLQFLLEWKTFQFGAAFRKWGFLVLTFFEKEWATVIVTSERFFEILRNFLRLQLRRLLGNMEEMWFQSKVYVRKPRTVDYLKVSIREEIAEL